MAARTEERPPWLYLVVLPDDQPPAAEFLASLPPGSKILALCADLAEKTIVRIGYDLAKEQYEIEMEQQGLSPDNG